MKFQIVSSSWNILNFSKTSLKKNPNNSEIFTSSPLKKLPKSKTQNTKLPSNQTSNNKIHKQTHQKTKLETLGTLSPVDLSHAASELSQIPLCSHKLPELLHLRERLKPHASAVLATTWIFVHKPDSAWGIAGCTQQLLPDFPHLS